jgi:hypothetical protein
MLTPVVMAIITISIPSYMNRISSSNAPHRKQHHTFSTIEIVISSQRDGRVWRREERKLRRKFI